MNNCMGVTVRFDRFGVSGSCKMQENGRSNGWINKKLDWFGKMTNLWTLHYTQDSVISQE